MLLTCHRVPCGSCQYLLMTSIITMQVTGLGCVCSQRYAVPATSGCNATVHAVNENEDGHSSKSSMYVIAMFVSTTQTIVRMLRAAQQQHNSIHLRAYRTTVPPCCVNAAQLLSGAEVIQMKRRSRDAVCCCAILVRLLPLATDLKTPRA
jgi:hypothetical protein